MKVDKIIRAKLDDGFYVYHEFGMAKKKYKPSKIVYQSENMAVKETQPYIVRSDFIEDNNIEWLKHRIMEAQMRANRKLKLKR